MAYNNAFPITYPYYNNLTPNFANYPQNQPSNVQQNGIIWVQGEAGAKSYLIAPNNTVQLWDSEKQVIYLKSADASGMPSMKILDYTIRNNEPQTTPIVQTNDVEYVTKDEFNSFVEKIQSQLEKPKKEAKEK